MRISDWSSDVCSSDLRARVQHPAPPPETWRSVNSTDETQRAQARLKNKQRDDDDQRQAVTNDRCARRAGSTRSPSPNASDGAGARGGDWKSTRLNYSN